MELKRIKKVLDAFVFNRHVTPKKLFNLALIFVQHQFLKNSKVVGYPLRMVIEPTNVCNLSCPLCPAARDLHDHKRGMMSLDDFKKIIDEVGAYLYEIDLFDFGESLLNPKIYDMIRYAADRNIRTNLSSNLNVVDVDRLVESGLSRLIASVDGTSQETYKQYRVHGDYDKVMGHIKAIAAKKKALGTSEPELVWRFIVMEQNRHQVPEMYRLAEELGMKVDLLPMRLNTSIDKEVEQDSAELRSKWLPMVDMLRRDNYKAKKPPRVGPDTCLFLWNQLTITWSGIVTPCCAIFDAEAHNFGHVREDGGVLAVWNGDAYQRARKMVRLMDPDLEKDKKFDMCAGCIKHGFVDV
ncbi:MAG: SPASM domain-containing protein [Elusimicrobia bacterium]|nr:SPASM domain-containing protein [Elusimicrobiota bacterium]